MKCTKKGIPCEHRGSRKSVRDDFMCEAPGGICVAEMATKAAKEAEIKLQKMIDEKVAALAAEKLKKEK